MFPLKLTITLIQIDGSFKTELLFTIVNPLIDKQNTTITSSSMIMLFRKKKIHIKTSQNLSNKTSMMQQILKISIKKCHCKQNFLFKIRNKMKHNKCCKTTATYLVNSP